MSTAREKNAHTDSCIPDSDCGHEHGEIASPQDLEGVVSAFQEKSDKSFAVGGFLTTDLGDEFRVDVDLQEAWLRTSITSLIEVERERIESRVGFMRQWLNEDRITDPKKMVDSAELLHWIYPTPKQ